jgi:RimJ/RimL family protein N-acetyltransferase
MGPPVKFETPRLTLRHLAEPDAPFILRLLNEPSFLRFIGDKGVRTLEDAAAYIRTGPVASYQTHGFGLYLVTLRETGASIGICGLVTRDWLEHPDIGFSLLPAYWSRGYAREAASAVLDQARDLLGVKRVLAITSLDNHDSIQLLKKLGFTYSATVHRPVENEQLNLFALDLNIGNQRQEAVRTDRSL